jgi:hypothetical protein
MLLKLRYPEDSKKPAFEGVKILLYKVNHSIVKWIRNFFPKEIRKQS